LPSFLGSQNRKKYHDESTNVSIVSVSRFAGPPHFQQVAFTNSGICASGESPRPLNSAVFGSTMGRSSSRTGTMPHLSQYRMGMGVPQYRWREMPQSLSRY